MLGENRITVIAYGTYNKECEHQESCSAGAATETCLGVRDYGSYPELEYLEKKLQWVAKREKGSMKRSRALRVLASINIHLHTDTFESPRINSRCIDPRVTINHRELTEECMDFTRSFHLRYIRRGRKSVYNSRALQTIALLRYKYAHSTKSCVHVSAKLSSSVVNFTQLNPKLGHEPFIVTLNVVVTNDRSALNFGPRESKRNTSIYSQRVINLLRFAKLCFLKEISFFYFSFRMLKQFLRGKPALKASKNTFFLFHKSLVKHCT